MSKRGTQDLVDSRKTSRNVVGLPNELTEHSYDGIQEYDNPLPGWWKWMFFGSIFFAFPYVVYYHSSVAPTLEQRYTTELAENAILAFSEIGELHGDKQTIVKYLQDAKWVAYGESVYKANCVTCHGANGGGLVGPNLCDEEYLHVNQIEDIYTIVNVGANRGAMPAWLNRLSQNDRVLVAVYVAHLRGTKPSGTTKAPQGKMIPPWPVMATTTNLTFKE